MVMGMCKRDRGCMTAVRRCDSPHGGVTGIRKVC